MKIKIVLIFCIFCPPLTTQGNATVKNQIICSIAGRVWRSTYDFDKYKLPERCDIIVIGQFAFDRDDNVDTHVMESDKDIMRSLVKANIPVYTRLGFEISNDWGSIFYPTDLQVFQTEKFDPLVNFLNKFKINGILINWANIYDISSDDIEQKISDFVSAIKRKVDKLIVGLLFSGWLYENFENKTLFDFSITNDVLDLYIIDWSFLNECTNDTVKIGLSPITSTNPDIITIENVTYSVTNSGMDESKIYAMVQMFPFIPRNLLPKDAFHSITTYSIYCGSTDKANSSQWCSNPSNLSYEQGVYAKKFYKGIVLEVLDTDDYESKCECGPFPVSNLVIDGWTGCPLKSCPKLD